MAQGKAFGKWVIINGTQYDVSRWIDRHPGGPELIEPCLGQDVTIAFESMHSKDAAKYLVALPKKKIEIEEEEDKIVRDFKQLQRDAEKFYTPRKDWYVQEIARCLALFGLFWASLIFFPNAYVCGILLAVWFQQAAGVGHDLGHNYVTFNTRYDTLMGLFFGNFGTGVSINWWKLNHNVHHAFTNHINHDPDIQHLPFLCFDTGFFQNLYSTFFKRIMPFDAIAQFLIPYQQYLYFPLMAVARFNLYGQSWKTAVLRPHNRTPMWLEISTLAGFVAWMYYATTFFATAQEKLIFIAVSHAIAGILHVQIIASHYSMPAVTETFDIKTFILDQIRTSTDITCSTWMDWFFIGLQFQTTHHLLPRVTRPCLREARELVKEFCAKHDIKYHENSFYQTQVMVLKQLGQVSKSSPKWSSLLSDAVNLNG